MALGRPDMALFKFTRAMLAGETIDVYGNGQLVRDFTYIDDIVEGVLRVLDKPATADAHFDPLHPNPATSSAPYRIFNIGNSTPTVLLDYIAALESALGITAKNACCRASQGTCKAPRRTRGRYKHGLTLPRQPASAKACDALWTGTVDFSARSKNAVIRAANAAKKRKQASPHQKPPPIISVSHHHKTT